MTPQQTKALSRRLLLVEVDRHNIDDLRDAFGQLGYECEVALELDTARAILRERRMGMAVINARAIEIKEEVLIEELKGIAPHLLLVIYNGTESKIRQRKLRRLGADSYLSAGNEMRAVVRSVRRLFEQEA